MQKKIIFWILYLIGIIFVLSGAVNNGFSRFFMAIPFMILICLVGKFGIKRNKLFYFSIFMVIFSIIVNLTQTKNPLIYPVLSNGYIEILEDGYHIEYSDGSGMFISEEERNDRNFIYSEDTIFTDLKKGEKYKVIGIKVAHPEFGTNVKLVTEVGQFSEYDYKSFEGSQKINVNKNVQSSWSKKLSFLMLWPLFPGIFLSLFKF